MLATMIYFSFTRPLEEYEDFFDIMDKIANHNWIQLDDHLILSQYNFTPQGCRKRLLPAIYSKDKLLVCTLDDTCAGKMPEHVRKWLKANVFTAE